MPQEHQEVNTIIPQEVIDINILPEIVSEGHASRHEPDDLSTGHASQQEPTSSDTSNPISLNVLPETVSEGHVSWHEPCMPRTQKEMRRKSKRNKNMKLSKPMKLFMRVHEEKCDSSGVMLNINKKQESIPNPSYSVIVRTRRWL